MVLPTNTSHCKHSQYAQPTFSIAEIVLKVSFDFFLLSCFLQQNDIWILRLGNEIFSRYSKCSQFFLPWVEECWPSSADSCQDHPTSRPCASAPGRHWTSCPWWLSSPGPRCCLSRRKSLRPRGSCVQEPRRKPAAGEDYWIVRQVLTYRSFGFLEAVTLEVDRFEVFPVGRGRGLVSKIHDHWGSSLYPPYRGVQVDGRSLNDPELSRTVTSSVLDHLAEIQGIFSAGKFIFEVDRTFVGDERERERKETFLCWPFLLR